VPAATIRRIANEYLEGRQRRRHHGDRRRHAALATGCRDPGQVGQQRLGRLRVLLGAHHVLAVLVGALENPGGTLGTTVRLNRPHDNRHKSVLAGEDGFMAQKFNPTDKANWAARPTGRNMHRTLVPIVGNTAWSQALGPTQLAWMFQREQPSGSDMPQADAAGRLDHLSHQSGDFLLGYARPWSRPSRLSRLPSLLPTRSMRPTTWQTCCLPEATDLESVQMIRVGGTKFMEQFWDHKGVALRQPAVAAQGDTRDFSWVSTQLAKPHGSARRNTTTRSIAVRRVSPRSKARTTISASTPTKEHAVRKTIWDSVCRASTTSLSEGK
jgi:phenylacetyl-CoA:acceptor oxidoreductase